VILFDNFRKYDESAYVVRFSKCQNFMLQFRNGNNFDSFYDEFSNKYVLLEIIILMFSALSISYENYSACSFFYILMHH